MQVTTQTKHETYFIQHTTLILEYYSRLPFLRPLCLVDLNRHGANIKFSFLDFILCET